MKAFEWMLNTGEGARLKHCAQLLWLTGILKEAVDSAIASLPRAACRLSGKDLDAISIGGAKPSPLLNLGAALSTVRLVAELMEDEGCPVLFMVRGLDEAHRQIAAFLKDKCRERELPGIRRARKPRSNRLRLKTQAVAAAPVAAAA